MSAPPSPGQQTSSQREVRSTRPYRRARQGSNKAWPACDRYTADAAFRQLVRDGYARELQPASEWSVCEGTAHLVDKPQVHRLVHVRNDHKSGSFLVTKLRHHARDPRAIGQAGIEEFQGPATHLKARFIEVVSDIVGGRPIKPLPSLKPQPSPLPPPLPTPPQTQPNAKAHNAKRPRPSSPPHPAKRPARHNTPASNPSSSRSHPPAAPRVIYLPAPPSARCLPPPPSPTPSPSPSPPSPLPSTPPTPYSLQLD